MTMKWRKCTIVATAVVMALMSGPAIAGSLGKGVAKTAIARIAKAPARETVARSVPRASTGVAKEASERAALQKQLRALDDHARARLERRYGADIASSRLREARTTGTRFLDHGEYQRQLRRNYPEMPAGQRRYVVGNYVNSKTYVDRNQVTLPRTTAHERVHQYANPRYRSEAGSRLDEGTTEYFASRAYGDLRLRDMPVAYPRERRLVEMMSARVGDRPLARAYYRGATAPLRKQLDGQLGAGAFDDVARAAERADYGTAERILKYGRGARWARGGGQDR